MSYARKPANLTKIRKTYGKTVQVDGYGMTWGSNFIRALDIVFLLRLHRLPH